MENIKLEDWGLIAYSKAYERQKRIFEELIRQKINQGTAQNTLIFCEHPHVITIGKNGTLSNLLFPESVLKEKKVELFHVDRGGDITYHGPGQLVGYPIFDLESFGLGLKEYIFRVEETIIRLLQLYGIQGERIKGAAGVWLQADNSDPARKICAIGVRSSRFVTMHGLALNVHTNLDYFRLINPCGFTDKKVTSMKQELGMQIDLGRLKKELFSLFSELFPIY